MAKLTFRLAQSSDFPEIIKLSEGIYQGHDYLPANYHTWMEMENSYVMLAFAGEKLVSLVAFFVVDEGKTYVTRAGRTLPEFRGQGAWKALLKAVAEFVREKFPLVSRHRFVTLGHVNPSLKVLGLEDSLAYYVKEAALRTMKIPAVDSVEVQSCTKDYICKVTFFPAVAMKVFPNDLIDIEFFPIEPRRSNIELLMQEYGNVYFAVEKSTDDVPPSSVSFGVHSSRVKFTHWRVTICTQDPLLYEAHLLHQFRLACDVIEGTFLFATIQDKRFGNCGRRVLEEVLELKAEEFLSEQTIRVYEDSVSSSSV